MAPGLWSSHDRAEMKVLLGLGSQQNHQNSTLIRSRPSSTPIVSTRPLLPLLPPPPAVAAPLPVAGGNTAHGSIARDTWNRVSSGWRSPSDSKTPHPPTRKPPFSEESCIENINFCVILLQSLASSLASSYTHACNCMPLAFLTWPTAALPARHRTNDLQGIATNATPSTVRLLGRIQEPYPNTPWDCHICHADQLGWFWGVNGIHGVFGIHGTNTPTQRHRYCYIGLPVVPPFFVSHLLGMGYAFFNWECSAPGSIFCI